MPRALILASSSQIRLTLLQNAGLDVTAVTPRVDEDSLRDALVAESASAHDIADALAEAKARKIAQKYPDQLVLGCDQVLALGGRLFSKPDSPDRARQDLKDLRGKQHHLYSAVVLYDGNQPIWRHVGTARLTMRALTDAYIDDYLARNWHAVQHAVGCYLLEQEGVRLFSAIEGDYFTILGLPMLQFLSYFATRGFVTT